MAIRDWYCEDVLSGKVEVSVVWEDKLVLAFHHPAKSSEVHLHVVIIPKEHIPSILDPKAKDGVLLSSMVTAIQEVAKILGLDQHGFYIRSNVAGEGITPHMHWHIRDLETH